jgi:hypothetical protein
VSQCRGSCGEKCRGSCGQNCRGSRSRAAGAPSVMEAITESPKDEELEGVTENGHVLAGLAKPSTKSISKGNRKSNVRCSTRASAIGTPVNGTPRFSFLKPKRQASRDSSHAATAEKGCASDCVRSHAAFLLLC